MKINIPRLMIVGTGSGCGKTTVTCALLKCFTDNLKKVSAFKCGPDYIDPMFHTKIIGTNSRNLDLYMCGEDTVKYLFAKNSLNSDISIIEGVMGIYDGMGFDDDKYSANHISSVLDTPEILVVNVGGKSFSILAEIYGYMTYKKNNLSGVILNNCSCGMYNVYKKHIEEKLNIKVFGYLPKIENAKIGSRHLGLITADEINDLKEKINALGEVAKETLSLDELLSFAKCQKPFEYNDIEIKKVTSKNINIAVAKDNAFCFYYEDSLDLLKQLGANLIYFSPLCDTKLPENISGIILGGGYPEENIEKLSNNKSMLKSIKTAYENNIPIYAECGGFMYLGKNIKINDIKYEMVNIFDNSFYMTNKLVRFGYSKLTSKHDNILCNKDDSIFCHEFHYSDSDNNGNSFISRKKNGRFWDCIIADNNIFAGYPHIHFWSNVEFAKKFILSCEKYKKE